VSTAGTGAEASHSPFLPLALLTVAVVAWFGYQTVQLVGERSAQKKTLQDQEQVVQNAGKMRAQLDALAAETQRLADQGNPNAKLLVEELRRRGITINPNAAKPASSP
jgi:cell division protein FtsB